MSVHTITTTLQRIYTPKVPTKISFTTNSTTTYVYIGKDERAMTDYGYMGADMIISLYHGAFQLIARGPLYALTTAGSVQLAIMEV